jgi:aminopeptidase C
MSKINANPFIFNHEINPKFSITDQKSSGRCWLFASCNILRVMASNNSELSAAKDLEFSQTYLYFWDKLERYHRSLQYFLKIKDMNDIIQDRYLNNLYKEALGDGGQWDMAKELIKKYGIVPKQAMPDSFHSKNSATMNTLVELAPDDQSHFNAVLLTMDHDKLRAMSEKYDAKQIAKKPGKKKGLEKFIGDEDEQI